MRCKRFFVLLAATALCLLTTRTASAATLYWVGGIDADFNLASNWSSAAGGAGGTTSPVNNALNFTLPTAGTLASTLLSADIVASRIGINPSSGNSGPITIGGAGYALTLSSTDANDGVFYVGFNQGNYDTILNVGTISLGSAVRCSRNSGLGSVTINSKITGSAALSLGNSSASTTFKGIYTLAGDNSGFSGGINLGYGTRDYNTTLRVNHANALGTGTLRFAQIRDSSHVVALDNTSGSAITVATATPIAAAVDFTFTGTNALNLGAGAVDIGSTGATRTITAAANTLTLGGQVSGTNALAKAGDGTLVLSGNSDYSGATAVNAGTFAVDGSLGGAGAVSVAGGATLSGIGSINGAVTVADLGNVSAGGPSVGTLTINNSLTVGSTSTLAFDLAAVGASDKISMASSDLSINGLDLDNLNLTALAGFGVGSYVLVDANSISGTWGDNLTGTLGGFNVALGGVGGDMVLSVTAVPEPSTLAMLSAALLGLVAYAWRKRK